VKYSTLARHDSANLRVGRLRTVPSLNLGARRNDGPLFANIELRDRTVTLNSGEVSP
jgi:hypothetical protein